MGPRIPRRRKLVRKNHDEQSVSDPINVKTLNTSSADAPDRLTRGPDRRQHRSSSTGVTHRSPSPDDMLLPCCGRPVSEVSPKDQVTTDPEQVTCGR
jgi:hypothetical protein